MYTGGMIALATLGMLIAGALMWVRNSENALPEVPARNVCRPPREMLEIRYARGELDRRELELRCRDPERTLPSIPY